jgi:hypothetical protein
VLDFLIFLAAGEKFSNYRERKVENPLAFASYDRKHHVAPGPSSHHADLLGVFGDQSVASPVFALPGPGSASSTSSAFQWAAVPMVSQAAQSYG